ncbi:phosphohistidine phosphatase SixA [Thermodesulfobacteriota bacterium]
MKVYLMQHGKPVPKEVDQNRPLSDQGRIDIEMIAKFLTKRRVDIQRIFHSGKTRARETAEALMHGMDFDLAPIEISGLFPMDSVKDTADMIKNSEMNIMFVGHLPHLAKLLSLLVSGNENNSIANFQQGGLVCLENTNDTWSITWMLVPEIIYFRANKL